MRGAARQPLAQRLDDVINSYWREGAERRLYQWLERLELRPTDDLVRALHGRLDGFIDGYRFPDLLAALNRMLNRPPAGYRVFTTNRFRTLAPPAGDHAPDERFVYRKRRLEKRPETEHD